jgi:hypothetical protein
MASIRPAAVAGAFYPGDAEELRALLDDCFNISRLGPQGTGKPNLSMIAGMVPHAGPIFSGPCAAHLYTRLAAPIQRIIILGVNHRGRGCKAALSPWDRWRTPLGEVSVDNKITEFLEAQVRFLKRDAQAHSEEHSIEVQLPFLQRELHEFTFVPISLSHLSIDDCAELGAAIADAQKAEIVKESRTVILASSDLNHYVSPRQIVELDQLAINQVLALDPEGLLRVVEDKGISMCGVLPTAVMLFAAKLLGAKRASLLKHCHSGDVTPMRKVVGYASVEIDAPARSPQRAPSVEL